MLGDIKSARLIIVKGLLFLVTGSLAAGLLLVPDFSLRTTALLAIAVWCFARFYYFAFHVLERYVGRGYRYAGLLSAIRFAMKVWAEEGAAARSRDG